MYKINRKVDTAIERFNKHIGDNSNSFLTTYRTAAIFEPLPKIRDDMVILNPDLMLDNDRLVLPFNNLIFNLQEFAEVGDDLYAMLNNPGDSKDEDNGSILTIISLTDYSYTIVSMLFRVQLEDNAFSFYTPSEAHYGGSIDKGKTWDIKPHNIHDKIIRDVFEVTTQYVLEYLSIINNQEYFIVENKTTYRMPGGRKKKTISKSTFTIDKPREIRKRYVGTHDYLDGNGKPLKIGLERRGHWRNFKSDYFVNMKGKSKWINPVWVGPSSFVDQNDPNKRYIVRLDL